MASADEQAARNEQIAADKAAGMTIAAIALKHGVSVSNVKRILKERRERQPARPGARELAEQRRDDYAEVLADVRKLARWVPYEQASAKVGAFKVVLDALDRLTAIEQQLGYLPGELRQIGDERRFVDAFEAVAREFDIGPEAVAALQARLEGELWAA